MTELQTKKQEQAILQAGGLAGILGSIIFLIVFVIVGVFVGADPVELDEFVTKFPEIRTARTFENSLYLLVLILWIPHTLALYHALKTKALAPALFGACIGISGLLLMAASALPHIPSVAMSELYHAPDATPEDQAALALMWQVSWTILESILIAGLAFMPFALLSFGFAMRQHPDFSPIHSGLSFVLGVLGLGIISFTMANPDSPMIAILVLGLIVFHIVIGWKLFSLSKSA